MWDNIFKAHKRWEEEKREENSLQKQWEAEGPGEKRQGVRWEMFFMEKRRADCTEQWWCKSGRLQATVLLVLSKERLVKRGTRAVSVWCQRPNSERAYAGMREGQAILETVNSVSLELKGGMKAEASRMVILILWYVRLWHLYTSRNSQGKRKRSLEDWIMWSHQSKFEGSKKLFRNQTF